MSDENEGAAGLDFTALGLRAVREACENERDFPAWRLQALQRVRQGLDGRPPGVTRKEESIADASLSGSVVWLKTAVVEARRRGLDPDAFLAMLFEREGPVPQADEW